MTTPLGFIQFLHPEMKRIYREEDQYECHAGILAKWDGQHLSDRLFAEEDFYDEILNSAGQEDRYFSINSYYSEHRNTDSVRHLNAIVLDYDFYKLDDYQDLSPAEMFEIIRPTLPVEPTFAVDSGRGLYLIFAIHHCPYQATNLYKCVYDELQKQQQPYGADPKATLVTQVIRIPGTVNSRSGRTVEVISVSENRYTLTELADLILPFTREQVQSYKKNKKKAKSFTSTTSTQFGRDLQKLIYLRNKAGVSDGYREQLLYLYWESLLWTNLPEQSIQNKVLAMNSYFSSPMDEKTVLRQCKPAKKYKFRSSKKTIISKLAITDDEMKSLQFLVSSDVKRKKNQRQKRRTNCGKTEKKQQLHARREKVIELIGSMKIGEIAELFGVSKKTILRDLDYIASNLRKFQDVLHTIWLRSITKVDDFVQMIILASCDVAWSGLPEIRYKSRHFMLI